MQLTLLWDRPSDLPRSSNFSGGWARTGIKKTILIPVKKKSPTLLARDLIRYNAFRISE
jgi:hypothetical protein